MLTEVSEAKEPNFLRRLREEHGGRDSARHERPLNRPRKQKAQEDDDDDAPTYVDEENQNTFSKAEYETLVNNRTTLDTELGAEGQEGKDMQARNVRGNLAMEDKTIRSEQQLAEIGSQKKRRAVKVIGDEMPDQMDAEKKPVLKTSRTEKKPNKRKKVKLSFDDDTEG